MKFGLPESELAQIKSVLAGYQLINVAILYGSRAKGNFKSGSDIDLTLKGDKLSHQDLLQISLELDDLLLLYEFDLSLFNDIANDDLLEHIARVGMVLYSSAQYQANEIESGWQG